MGWPQRTCELTSKRTKSSPMGGRQDVPPGTVQSCSFTASVRCLGCGTWLCPGHSKRVTDMVDYRTGEKRPNAGKRICSNCKAVVD